jgi:hypothetical protein
VETDQENSKKVLIGLFCQNGQPVQLPVVEENKLNNKNAHHQSPDQNHVLDLKS